MREMDEIVDCGMRPDEGKVTEEAAVDTGGRTHLCAFTEPNSPGMRNDRATATNDGILEAITAHCGVGLDADLGPNVGVGKNYGTWSDYGASLNVNMIADYRHFVDLRGRAHKRLQSFEFFVLDGSRKRRIKQVVRVAVNDQSGVVFRNAIAQVGAGHDRNIAAALQQTCKTGRRK